LFNNPAIVVKLRKLGMRAYYIHSGHTGRQETRQGLVGGAIDRIRELRKQNMLGGLKAKDLIHEGRKY
jgi:hypothetical protein